MIPKFRAWDKEHDEMLYPDDVDKIFFEITVDGIVTYDMRYILPYDDIPPYLDTVIMQSTGLHDVNSREIFEGDIVNVSIVDCEPKIFANKKCTGIVSFVNGHTDIEIESETYLGLPCLECTGTYDLKFKVLGNIHEHSHLLDKGGEEE